MDQLILEYLSGQSVSIWVQVNIYAYETYEIRYFQGNFMTLK